MSLAREIRLLRSGLRMGLRAGRERCAAHGSEVAARKRAEHADAVVRHERARAESGAAYQEARGAKSQAFGACMVGAKNAPKKKRGERRRACKAQAEATARKKRGKHQAAKRRADAARVERSGAFRESRGARRRAEEACMVPVREKAARERRAADDLEGERRSEAKRRRGGRRPPVSPAERAQELIQKARNEVEVRDPDLLPFFEEVAPALFRRWSAERAERKASGRTHTLAESFFDLVHDSPDEAEAARIRAAEAEDDANFRRQYEEYARSQRRRAA